jgi:isoleucyl-tRNA synthetase
MRRRRRACAWPQAEAGLTDASLLAEMSLLMQVVSLGRAARQKAALKVRQPLAEMLVKVKSPAERASITVLREQILDELNVKALGFVDEESDLVSYLLRPVHSVLGPKYGKRLPAIQAALSGIEARQGARTLQRGESLSIVVDGETLLLAPDEVKVFANERSGYSVAEEGGYVAAVSTTLTPELRREGLARDLVRRLQEMRKSAGLDIADRIHVRYVAGENVAAVLTEFRASVAQETLAVSLEAGEGAGYREDHSVEGEPLTFWIDKA